MDARTRAQPGPHGSLPRNTAAADSTNINSTNLTYTAVRNMGSSFGARSPSDEGLGVADRTKQGLCRMSSEIGD